ncbi:transposase [Streptomyces sp. NPDC000941]
MVLDVVASELEALVGRVAGRFGRAEPRRRVREYVSGLVAGLPRSNGWILAEQAGEVSPDGMQRLLRRADWDIAGVRDDVRAHMVERLGAPGGVLIVDDTGFLKKGNRSAACSASTPARPVGWRTARSALPWPTAQHAVTR